MVATYASSTTLTRNQLQAFHQDGYLILRGLFRQDEIAELLDTFMTMHAGGPIPGCFSPASKEEAAADPLKRYPRMMHPHRINEVARRYLLDDRLERVLTALFDEEPLAAQTMVYFKPPGGRGQAQHQDKFFL